MPGRGPGALKGQVFILLLLDHEGVEGIIREGPEMQMREGVWVHFLRCRPVTIFQCRSISIW